MTSQAQARLRLLIVGVAIFAAAVVLWRFTPLASLVTPARLAHWLETFQTLPGAPLLVVGIFVAAGLIVFPLTLLIAATAIVFDPPVALCVAFAGALASASLTYWLGSRFLRGTATAALGQAQAKVKAALDNNGVIAVAALRTLPVAPFTLVNIAAGSLGVPFRDYLSGTAIGITPGALMLTAFGSRLQKIIEQPSVGNVLTLAGVIGLWIALSFSLQRWLARVRSRRQTATSRQRPSNGK